MFLLQFFVSGICKDIVIASLGEDIPKKLLEAGRTSFTTLPVSVGAAKFNYL